MGLYAPCLALLTPGSGADVSVAGSQWNAGASPSLAHLIQQAALEIPHPTQANKTLWDAKNDQGSFTHGQAHPDSLAAYEARLMSESASTGIGPLGSGSDFTAFLQRLGVSHTTRFINMRVIVSARLRVWIKASRQRLPMRCTTITPFMIHRGGKSCMPTPASIAM